MMIIALDGDYVGKIGTRGTVKGQLSSPYGVLDLYGFILVADTMIICQY